METQGIAAFPVTVRLVTVLQRTAALLRAALYRAAHGTDRVQMYVPRKRWSI